MSTKINESLPQWYYEQVSREAALGAGYFAKPMLVENVPMIAEPKKQAKAVTQRNDSKLKTKRAWDLALAPLKGLPTTLIFAWFSGTSLQMVTITMTAYMFFISPFMKILQLRSQFEPLKTKNNAAAVDLACFVGLLAHIVVIAVGIYRIGQMGLLPTSSSDWLEWQPKTDLTWS